MDKAHYHGEVVTSFQDLRQSLDVRLFPSSTQTGGAPVIELTCWNERQGTEVYSAGVLSPTEARCLAGHLRKAAELAEPAVGRHKILMGDRYNITVLTENAVPGSTPCDETIHRCVFSRRKRNGSWTELFRVPSSDFAELHALMEQADEIIATVPAE